MKKEKTKMVGNWHELVDFVESINPNKKTIVLTGWINEMYQERTYIKSLMFTTKDVNILREKVKKNGTNTVVKKPITKNKK